MFRTTWFVKAFAAVGFDFGVMCGALRSRAFCGSGDGVGGRLGDPVEVRYPGGCLLPPHQEILLTLSALAVPEYISPPTPTRALGALPDDYGARHVNMSTHLFVEKATTQARKLAGC
ncbi:hypothetical protein BKA61DRAFT_660858, partial [Leptodontidium sp. MPI-SDFR-AT-0119]